MSKKRYKHLKPDNELTAEERKPNPDYKPKHLNNSIEEVESDIELNSCSMCDCTGLIPAAITDSYEMEAYEELYPYLPPTNNINSDNRPNTNS